MKPYKKVIALLFSALMALNLCSPVFACSHDNVNLSKATPFGPAEPSTSLTVVSLNSVLLPTVLREDPNAACGIPSHIPPSNYRYVGCTHGNTQVEIAVTGIGAALVGIIPQLGLLMATLSAGVTLSELLDYLDNGILLGEYYKYTWTDGTHYFYHIVWVSDYDGDGHDTFLACKVVTG